MRKGEIGFIEDCLDSKLDRFQMRLQTRELSRRQGCQEGVGRRWRNGNGRSSHRQLLGVLVRR
jgi:hypothetical protein